MSDTKLVRQLSKDDIANLMSTEQYVRGYFEDIPIMIQIAKCESHFKHLTKDGEVHRGRIVREDVGVMQINEYYHLEQSIKKNLNIHTLEGNLDYARDLYERQGTRPWNSSKACWGKYQGTTLAMN
ncbi:MAG: hypothetical protein WAW92_04750 [Minisyncoccia bacterium]